MKKKILGIAMIASIVSSVLTGCIVREDRYHHGPRDHDRGRDHYYRNY